VEELEGEFRSKMEAELQRLQALDEAQRKVEAARRHIEEEVPCAVRTPPRTLHPGTSTALAEAQGCTLRAAMPDGAC
jgi:hypothetical protein